MRNCFLALLLFTSAFAQAYGESNKSAPEVLASIKPVHLLVASIMQGVGQPELLLRSNQSPHHYSLKPSERRKIAQADLIFWIGPNMENFMPRLLSSLESRTQVVSLVNSKGLTLLPVRQPGHGFEHHDNNRSQIDAHIWLNTHNIEVMANVITRTLVSLDPDNSQQYKNNNKILLIKIRMLRNELTSLLRDKQQPFLTYHDGYQYFEHEFNLKNSGFISINPELRPSAKHIQSMKEQILKHTIECIFYDAPAEPPIIASLLADNPAKAVELDPLGITLQPNKQDILQIMHAMGEKFHNCL